MEKSEVLKRAYLNDDVHIKLLRVQSDALVEVVPLGIVQVHGDVHLQTTDKGVSNLD